jgi:hypothetical protein
MDKTQDTIIRMSYVPLLCGSLLAIAFLVVSLYTQQGKVINSDGLKREPSTTDIEDKQDIEGKQDIKDEDSAPNIRYVKYYQDLPKEYCCRAMKEGVEDRGFIEYYRYYDEYCFSSYDGYPLSTMRYCPYCGKEIASLRALFGVMQTRYMREKGWNLDQVYRYWDLYREGKSQEEAERIVEQERNPVSS